MVDKLDFEMVDACPLCGGKGVFYRGVNDMGVIVTTDKCTNCGVVYHNPRQTRDSLDWYYSKGKYHAEHPSSATAERNRANRYTMLIRGFEITPRRFLDYGSGRGFLGEILTDTYGTESINLELAYRPWEAAEGTIRTRDDIEGKFDLITCIHVLEHLYDPQEALHWMADRLVDGGTIILELPFDDKVYLPHVFIFNHLSTRMMFERLNLQALHITHNTNAIFMVGEQYGGARIEETVMAFNSHTIRDGLYH